MRHKPYYVVAFLLLFIIAATGQTKAADELTDLQTALNSLATIEKNLDAAINSLTKAAKAWEGDVSKQLTHASGFHGDNETAKDAIKKATTTGTQAKGWLDKINSGGESLIAIRGKVKEMKSGIKSSIDIIKAMDQQSSSSSSTGNRTRIVIRIKL